MGKFVGAGARGTIWVLHDAIHETVASAVTGKVVVNVRVDVDDFGEHREGDLFC